MTKKRWSTEEKYRIEIGAFTTTASTTDIHGKCGLLLNTLYPWREKFPEGCKDTLVEGPSARATKALQKENAMLKTLVGEITLASDA